MRRPNSPESVAEMCMLMIRVATPALAGSMALFSLVREKYFDIKDQNGRSGLNVGVGRDNSWQSASEALQARQWILTEQQHAFSDMHQQQHKNYNQYASKCGKGSRGGGICQRQLMAMPKINEVRENDDGTVTKYYTDGSEEQGNEPSQ